MNSDYKERLREVALYFTKLGFTAFGGPSAHVAMMEEDIVERRKWMSRQHFLDLMGATNLIPGPNSTEMTMHIGYERAGILGLWLGGICFIVPAVFLTVLCAWVYVDFGEVPMVEGVFWGIKPVIIVIIFSAVFKLGEKAVKSTGQAVVAMGVLLFSLLGLSELVLLLGGGILGMIAFLMIKGEKPKLSLLIPPILLDSSTAMAAGTVGVAATAVSLTKLGFFFLKIGCVLYGSGYVLIAFLEGGLVQDYGWITEEQLLDAVAIGQFTPGPLFSTSAFIGYLIAGVPGAIVSAVGIFLPAFFFVHILNPIIPRLRNMAWTAAFLDSVNAAAIALMLLVSLHLSYSILGEIGSWPIFISVAILLFRYKVSSGLLIIGGAVIGFGVSLF